MLSLYAVTLLFVAALAIRSSEPSPRQYRVLMYHNLDRQLEDINEGRTHNQTYFQKRKQARYFHEKIWV
jgi:hypothetical protein